MVLFLLVLRLRWVCPPPRNHIQQEAPYAPPEVLQRSSADDSQVFLHCQVPSHFPEIYLTGRAYALAVCLRAVVALVML